MPDASTASQVRTPPTSRHRDASDTEQTHPDNDRDSEPAESQCSEVKLAAVADGDDQNGADVVDDRQREHEDPQALRNTAPENGQAANDECGVGGHGNAPAMGAL